MEKAMKVKVSPSTKVHMCIYKCQVHIHPWTPHIIDFLVPLLVVEGLMWLAYLEAGRLPLTFFHPNLQPQMTLPTCTVPRL